MTIKLVLSNRGLTESKINEGVHFMFKNKEGKVRSGWLIAGVTAVSLALIMLVGVAVAIVMAAILTLRGLSPEDIVPIIEPVMIYIQEFVMIAVPIFAWAVILKRPLDSMGLGSWRRFGADLGFGLLLGALSISAVFIGLVWSGNAVVVSWTPQFSADSFYSLLIFIAVGFAEEIYSRGFVMSALRQTKSIPLAVIVSSAIFALLHSFNRGMGLIPYINLFLVGVLFAYMYLRSGSIWLCIGYHITWNYFQGSVFGFPVSGTNQPGIINTFIPKANILTGGQFGPEGGLAVTMVILLGFLIVRQAFKNRGYDFLTQEWRS